MKKFFFLFFALVLALILPKYALAATIVDQTANTGQNGVPSLQDVPSGTANVYFADDFVTSQSWDITTIFVPGADVTGTVAVDLNNATSLNWAIYGNDTTIPANPNRPNGNPEGGTAALWSTSITPPYTIAKGVTITGGLDVLLTLSAPYRLVPGHYWLVFYPTMDYETYGTWGRLTSGTGPGGNNAVAQFIVPQGGFGGPIVWTSAQDPYATSFPGGGWPTNQYDLAFRIEGTAASAPKIVVTPSSLDFGNTVVDNASLAKTITISNTGDVVLDVTNITVTGTSANMFTIATNLCVTNNINPSQSCTLSVTFTPSAEGAQSASLVISSNDPISSTVPVALSGTGVIPDINVTPAALSFGNIAVDQTSVAQTVTITNTSGASLSITSSITGTSAAMFALASGGTCSYPTDTLSPSEVCTLRVTFAPTEFGPQAAILEIVPGDSVTSVSQVALSGTGTYEVTPSATEGTYGSEIQYGGATSGFGAKKGKIYIGGNNKQKIDSWSNTQITMVFTKFKDMAVNTSYDVSIEPKDPKGTPPIVLDGAFTLRKPELPLTNTYSGAPNTEFTIPATDGQWFGTKKGKVYIGGEKCKVKEWTMNPTTGASSVTFVISKKLGAGTYALELENKIGRAVSAGFRVTGP